MNNRKQRDDLEIIITHCYSLGWESVKCGVLQGSVLGTLLFNIYMNDMPKIINKLYHTILIADDTSILVTSTDYIELNQKLHSNLHHILKWFETNQLVLNTDKAYIVKFTSSKAMTCPLNIIHVDQTLAVAETNKILGLHLDVHLPWKSHTTVLLKRLSSVYVTMRKLSYILNIDTLRIVYFAHFKSLIYDIIFWVSLTTMCNIFLTQKIIIIRIMLRLGSSSSCRYGFKTLDILTLSSLYIFALIMLVFRKPDHFET